VNDSPLPSDEGWVRLAALDRLPCGRAVRVDIDGQQVALFHTEGGLRAIDGLCPHLGGELSDGAFDDAEVTCPRHARRYDLRTGQRQDREGQPVHVYPTRIVDDWIWLAVPERR
jgi:nitrite reductase/ring-hydroxylating ferredoxin subunit